MKPKAQVEYRAIADLKELHAKARHAQMHQKKGAIEMETTKKNKTAINRGSR